MKITTRSPHLLHLLQLLGLALIGFVLWLAAIGWLLVTPTQAAPGEQRHGSPEKRLARMQTQLDLTPEQIDRIRPILEDQAARRQRRREKYRGQDRRAMRSARRALREETQTALATVPTPDQMAARQKLREERRRERQNRRSAQARP